MVVKIPFQNKAFLPKIKNRSAKIIGDLFVKCEIKNNEVIIEGGQLLLQLGTEFNEHQQPTFSNSKGYRKQFADHFDINFDNPNKKLFTMNKEQIKWWNKKLKFKSFGSFLSISKYLTGNNPTGAQKRKKSAEFILKYGEKQNLPFINLLRVFTKNGKLEFADFNYLEYENFDQFLNQVLKISDKYQYVVNNFYNNQFLYFYVDEMRGYLGIKDQINKTQKLRSKFRNNLISMYDRIDQFYKIFKSRKMVEAAHIKPVKSSTNDYEIEDINNGLLLSPDIHTLFDAGLITFDSTNGKVIYTKNSKDIKFNITVREVKILKLDDYYLDSKLLTEERVKYLQYHNQNVYHKGI